MNYSRAELRSLDTIQQAWDGDELKIETSKIRVWLTTQENRRYNGDVVVEINIDGKWVIDDGESCGSECYGCEKCESL